MSRYLPIEKLQFGFPDARQYQSKAELEKFKSIYFPNSDYIKKLKSEAVYFITGDKGTGKTALATWFINQHDTEVAGLSLFLQKDDFSRFHDFSKKQADFDQSDLGELWKAMLLLLILFQRVKEALIDQEKLPETVTDFFKKLEIMSFGAFDFSAFSAFNVLGSQARSFSALFFDKEFSGSVGFGFYLRRVQKLFIDLLQSIAPPQKRIFVFVDGIDVRPSAGFGSHVEHMRNVTNLINAIWTLNYSDLSDRLQKYYRIIVLVRPDIFERVELQNINNIWRVNTIQILFPVKPRHYSDSSLFKMADALLYSQQDFYENDAHYQVGDCWNHYLPDKDEITASRSNRKTRPDDSFISMLKNTFGRPRDVIYYLDYWRHAAQLHNDGRAAYFDIKYTRKSEFRVPFNDYLLGELGDSLSFYTEPSDYITFIQFFHHIQPFFPSFDATSKRDGRPIKKYHPDFDFLDFQKAYQNYVSHMNTTKTAIPEMFSQQEKFLQLLFELNLLSYKTKGVDRDIYKSYSVAKSEGEFRPQVRLDGSYRLHWGLARAIYRDFL